MKRGIVFLLCTCLLIACSEEKFESQEIVIEPMCSEEFNAVISNIASLNDQFDCVSISTKGSGRNLFTHVADYIGGVYGAKLGTEVGFAFGSVAGSPICGTILAGGCGAIGSMAGAAVASKLFGIVCDYAGIGYSVPIEELPGYNGNCAICPYEGSAGLLHNTILYSLDNNGKDYLDVAGNIMVEEMFHDALAYEENLQLDEVVYDLRYIDEIELFCKDLCSVMVSSQRQGLTNAQICGQIYGLLRVKGCSENEIIEIKALGDALLPCVSLDAEDVPAYELEFNRIIEASLLDESEKCCLETAGSVYIHSVQYWY